jgi:hypothetical protein
MIRAEMNMLFPSDDLQLAALVQRYCDGSCTPEERRYVEGNTELLARVAAQQQEQVDAVLRRLFADATGAAPGVEDWPSPQDLTAYVDGTLTETRQRFVEQCAERSPEIRTEIQLLQRLGRNPLTSL